MKHAVRQLAGTPSFTAVAILTLGLGIATVTTVFAIVDELALRPARNPGDPQVYFLHSTGEAGLQIPDYESIAAARPAGVEAIAAFSAVGGLAQVPGRAEYISGWRVSDQYAAVHAIRAQVGRWINDDDNVGGENDPTFEMRGIRYPIVRGTLGADVAVISDRLWREWFDADRAVVETGTLRLDGRRVRIVGVAPPGFESQIDLWQPFGSRRLLTRAELDDMAKVIARRPLPPNQPRPTPQQPTVQAQARLAAGASVREANDRLTAITSARPGSIEIPRGAVRLVPRLGNTRYVSTGYTILIFAALVFVAACANLGNMMYGRAMEREGELATRLALGASRRDIAAILFSETLIVAAAGTAAGLVIAVAALELFESAVPAFQITSWQRVRMDLGLDWRVCACASAAGAVASLIVGAAAIWRSSRAPLLVRLSAAGPAVLSRTEGRTLRTMLVAVQVSAAVLLLIATGLLLENTSKQLDRRLQFDTNGLIAARIELPDSYDRSRGAHFFDRLLGELRSIADIESAAIADALPGGETPAPRTGLGAITADPPQTTPAGVQIRIDGRWLLASPGFMKTVSLTSTGRDFDARDLDGTDPVAIVSQSVARKFWPDRDALGQQLICCGAPYKRTIVGVVADPVVSRGTAQPMTVADAVQAQTDTAVSHYVFLPAAQQYRPDMLVVARTSRPEASVDALRRAVAALDPDVPVFMAGRVNATQFGRVSTERAVRMLAGGLAAIALGITILGVSAVVSYFVSRRTREFGLRLALGASRRQIVKLVVDYSVHMTLIGLLPGVLFASLGTNIFQSELSKLRPNGVAMWVFVPLLLVACALTAAYIPARRAARVEPMKTLKEL